MAIRANHYDVAFEELLRQIRRPYVAVDEAKRTLIENASLKSLDFIVYSPGGSHLLVDVKGRRFPTGASGHCWESWIEAGEVDSLACWERVFGQGFRSVLVFAYEIREARHLQKHPVWWEIRRRRYAFYGVYANDYSRLMRPRSKSWETVFLRAADFDRIRHPLLEIL
jgi:hypothetical protein